MTKPSPHYSPFGSLISNRSWSDASREYRFGFNTQEKDNEVAGNGNSYTAEFWQYDGRLGRRFNVDPIIHHFVSGFSVLGNNPICYNDLQGNKWKTEEDAKMADDLKSLLDARKNQLLRRANRLNRRADRLEERGRSNKAAKIRSKAEDAKNGAIELGNAQKELDEIGKNENKTFTFKALDGPVGGLTTDEEGTIIINYVSTDNAIHELTHAYQAITGEIEVVAGKGILYFDLTDEQKAYKRQYIFDPRATTTTFFNFAGKLIKSDKDITVELIAKIVVNGVYIYSGFKLYQRDKPLSPAWYRQIYIDEQAFIRRNSG